MPKTVSDNPLTGKTFIEKNKKINNMKITWLLVAGLFVSFTIGFYINSMLAQPI
ncbi:MAG TPA: hypothetical protein VEV16_08540 [Daejeonella sp.]|nr:hypothetical protein [Daejeonella sp.]